MKEKMPIKIKRGDEKPQGHFVPKFIGFAAAAGILAIPAFACNPSEDTPSEPTPRSATATPIPEDTPTLVFETPILTPTSTLVPTSTPTPPTFTSIPEAMGKNTNFVFGEGVSLQEREEIRNAIGITRGWLFGKAGIEIDNLNVLASSNPKQIIDLYLERTIFPQDRNEAQRRLANYTAFVGEKKDIFIITSSPGWTSASPIIGGPVKEGRIHTILHELFHIVQREVGGYNGIFPHWLNEGSAHFVAAAGLDEKGIYPYEQIRQGHLREADKVKEPLKSMETAQGFYSAGTPYADEFSLAELGIEFLVKDLPEDGIPALVQFWEDLGKGTRWQVAFESSFDKTPDQFYQEFEEWRRVGFR